MIEKQRNSNRFMLRRCFAMSLTMVWALILTKSSYHIQQKVLPSSGIDTAQGPLKGAAHNKHKERTLVAPQNVVAYVVSFLECSDIQLDALLVLRHSIHEISSRNLYSGSSYDYKMYAMVPDEDCAKPLDDAGFEVVGVRGVRSRYYSESADISDAYFIKLLPFTLPEDIVVHVDTDSTFYKPMDDLFDAFRYDKSSPTGMAARSRVMLQHPEKEMPERIEAFLTRGQTELLVARSSALVFEEMLEAIRERSNDSGSEGDRGETGPSAMHDFVKYFYDKVRPGTAVELNHCRYNHKGTGKDAQYHNTPNKVRSSFGDSSVEGCRDGETECEDCQRTDFEDIHSVSYTMCGKPWHCMAQGESEEQLPGQILDVTMEDTEIIGSSHCLELVKKWHDLRTDLETKLLALTEDIEIDNGTDGTYREDVFNGHCGGNGNRHYMPLSASQETFRRIHELYSSRPSLFKSQV